MSLRVTKDVNNFSASLGVNTFRCEIDDADVLPLGPRPITARYLSNTAVHRGVERSKFCSWYCIHAGTWWSYINAPKIALEWSSNQQCPHDHQPLPVTDVKSLSRCVVLYSTHIELYPLQPPYGSLTAITRMVHAHFDSEPVDAVIRLPSATELHYLQNFHAHVSTCFVCRRSLTPVVRYHLLCEEGKRTATAACEVLLGRKGKICAVNATRLPYDVVVEVP